MVEISWELKMILTVAKCLLDSGKLFFYANFISHRELTGSK